LIFSYKISHIPINTPSNKKGGRGIGITGKNIFIPYQNIQDTPQFHC
jgi:hypothetical protein